ncbi:HSP20 family protein [Dyadobacter jejuensis]|uniref:HSP20 family protein n=1 Tax=Dyadobacter jejuensis TaxID=1082580 RepID=A0A316APZ0_9BACT|nr:Hsp20/alpha crystallin family protein [Dyadobacter jejuensis]PWJ59835.1 HSP20 family protein [Dyadobacter jejuensis]
MSTLVKSHFATPGYLNSVLGKDFFNDFGSATLGSHIPALNVFESKEGFQIQVVAPGLEKADFKLNLEKNRLTISVQKEKEEQEVEGKYTRREFKVGSFQRSFNLPDSVDEDKVAASYEAGILTVSLPKKEEAKEKPAREIEIQ